MAIDDYRFVAPFVGRSRELDEVERLLSGSRLVTVIGTGGAGKTRLASEAALRIAYRFPAGIFVCDLAPIADPAAVEAAFAAAFGFAPEARGDLGALTRQRLGEDSALLVVDNCEHLKSKVAPTLLSILEAAPGLRVLATSRERLGLAGETDWTVPSLRPDEALQLLVIRAATLDAAFEVSPKNQAALTEICARLEGLPLALELVAPRLALLPAVQVARMLDDALSVLGRGGGPARHRTMRATLDWSVALIRPAARADLWRLAIFPATFGLDAAATVLDASAVPALDRLTTLRDASLLVADTGGPAARFRLLEPVRQYAAGHLAGAHDEDEVRRRHALYVLRRAEWIGAHVLGTPEQEAALTAFAELLPDIRQAVAWGLEAEPAWAARIVGHTGWAWEITSRLREGEALERITLEAATDVGDRARLLTRLASMASRRGDPAVVAISDAAIAAARASDLQRELGMALGFGIDGLTPEGGATQLNKVAAQLDEIAIVAAETGDAVLLGCEHFFRGNLCSRNGNLVVARAHYEAATACFRALGDRWLTTQATLNLVLICLELGDNQAGRQYLRPLLPSLLEHPDWVAAPILLLHTARLASQTGRPKDALRLVAAQRRLREELGAVQRDTIEIERAARAALRGRSEVGQHLAEGAQLSVNDALALARDVVEQPAPRPDRRVTRRELEIVQLIGRGRSNREIADQLHVSVRTVEGHVEHVLNKLNFRSRVEIATWAAERSLLD